MVGIALLLRIRRICKNEIERSLLGIEVEETVGIHRLHHGFDLGHAEILADAAHALLVFINKNGGLRSPAQGLDSHAAGARKEVEHAGAGNAFAEAGKDGSADAVHRGTESIGRGFERTTACAASNDSHRGVSLSARE